MSAATPPRITEEDLNSYYIHDDGSLWRVVTYAAAPTATLECIRGREGAADVLGHNQRISGVVGSPIFAGLRKLAPVSPLKEKESSGV